MRSSVAHGFLGDALSREPQSKSNARLPLVQYQVSLALDSIQVYSQ